MKTVHSSLAPAFRALAVALVLAVLVPPASAQLVADGQTNVLDGVTNVIAGDVTVGTNGPFTSLVLTGGTLLTNTLGSVIGFSPAANSNNVWLDGSGTRWLMDADLYVGRRGSFNLLGVSNSALVGSVTGSIGFYEDSSDNVAIVTGAGSFWSNSLYLAVGYFGASNTLLITNGGLVGNDSAYIGAHPSASNNRVVISGAGSSWSNRGSLDIGSGGWGNSLLVANGGLVEDNYGFIGGNATGNSNMVVVTGSGSVWSNALDLYAGFYGAGNRLIIEDGARVENSIGYIGWNTTASNNQTVVSGSGSLWSNRADLHVGYFGSFNSLLITNGGRVRSGSCWVGYETSAESNQITVTGTGSFLVNTNFLAVGFSNSGNSIYVSNGGRVTNFYSYVGGVSNSHGNQAVVDGPGSLWSDKYFVVVGSLGYSNTVCIRNGGRMTNQYALVGYSTNANNNVVIVDGPNSLWSMQLDLRIGEFGMSNSVLLTNGGRLESLGGAVGGGSNANQVVITGSDSLWRSRSTIYVGYLSSSNLLLITNGGALTSPRVWVGSEPGASDNLLAVGGGSLEVTNSIGPGEVDIRRGRAVFNGGIIRVKSLLLTNIMGSFVFNDGMLNARSARIDNLACFAVGDGTSLATYRMTDSLTNAHSFANGLLINSNATLTGSGTIVGNVTNFGTLGVGSSAGAINVSGDCQFQPSASAIFELGGPTPTNGYDQLAVSNFVRFGGTLDLRLTNGFLPAPGDTFTLVKFASSSGIFNGVYNGLRINFLNGRISFHVSYENNLVLSAVQYRDSDGDGQGDLQEEAAGTDPDDAASVLRILSITPNASGHQTVLFQSEPAKTYRVEYSTNLANWAAALTNLPSAGATTQWTDDGTLTGSLPGTNRFYRVGLQ